MTKKKALIVARCSTNEKKQDVSRQTKELRAKYKDRFTFARDYAYYQSGTTNDKELKEILQIAIDRKVQYIIISVISRIARKVINVLNFCNLLTENGICLIIDNHNLETLNSDGKEDTNTKLILTIGATFAEMELKNTMDRMNSGRKYYIEKGGKLDRKVDSTMSDKDYMDKYPKVVKELKKGANSLRAISKLTDTSLGTVHKLSGILAKMDNK